MFKNYLEKKRKQRKKIFEAHEIGFEKGLKEKENDIIKLKKKYDLIIDHKNQEISNLRKNVFNIEKALNHHFEIIKQTNLMIKKLKSNSYAHSMLAAEDHREIESMNDQIELIEIKVNKSKNRLDDKIIEFKKIAGE